MRLEVLVESDDPKIFPLNQSEIMIGSGDNCDIILDADGISRKHVKIMSTGDQFFVIDQGSTNGTYINEERLIPGRKTDFTSFFPVRLGDKVLLTLLSDEEAGDSELSNFAKKFQERERSIDFDGESESTRAFSMNDLNKTPKKLELQKAQKTKSTVTRKVPVQKAKEEKSSMGKTLIFVLLMSGGAYYYNSIQKQASPEIINQSQPPKGKPPVVEAKVEEQPKVSWKIADEEILPKTKMSILLNDLKCFNPEEKVFCDLLPEKSEKEGVIQVGESFVILLEQKKWIEGAKQTLDLNVQTQAQGESSIYSPELYKISLLLSMKKILNPNNTQNFQEMNFYLVMYDGDAAENQVKHVLAVKRKAIAQIIPYLDDFNLTRVKKSGIDTIKVSEQYYSFY